MIDLTAARSRFADADKIPDLPSEVDDVLEDVVSLFEDLDGLDLDDSGAIRDQGRLGVKATADRRERAQASKDLLLLVDRLTLAASLVRTYRWYDLADRLDLTAGLVKNAYWVYKGEPDPLEPERAS